MRGLIHYFQLVSCALRRFYGYDSQYHAIPAGMIASVSFVMYPDTTVALYVMWKALQVRNLKSA